jgi:hypothetical protein
LNQYFTAAVRAAFPLVYTFIYTSVSNDRRTLSRSLAINLLVRIFVEAIMANAEEIKERRRQAFESYIREHLVAIDHYDSVGGKYIGSGTCIGIGGRVFLCTAAHNFQDIPKQGRVELYSTNRHPPYPLKVIGQNLSDFGKNGTLDIACLEIDPQSPRQRRPW